MGEPSPNRGVSAEGAAEVLAWQNRLRLGVAAVVATSGAVLRGVGAVAVSTVGAAQGLGPGRRTALAAGVAVAYLMIVAAAQRWVRRRRAAGAGLLALVFGADLVAIYATTFLVAPPEHYDRALFAAMFSLQLMQLYFGPGAPLLLAAVAALHVATLAVANVLGAPIGWGEELWTLALYVGGAGGFIALQANASRRLEALTRLFDRAQGGDFSAPYDEGADRRPDSVTRLGRAYNAMRSQLAAIVLTDPLSGCLNRRGFDQALTRELARASRAGAELAVLAVDVDYFKLINDTFGHLAGDAVIREIGQLLRENARGGDVVARVGGEEFMILAPDTSAAGAFNVAARMVEGFRRRKFEAVQGRIPVTVSIGVVSDRARDENAAEDLRARADEALYAAKRAGRNRVVLWTHGMKERGAAVAR